MGKRHYTPAELCMMAKKVKENSKVVLVAPFTKMAVFCSYILWKKEGWGRKRLSKYHEIARIYWIKLEEDENQWQTLQKRIVDIAGEDLYIDIIEEDISYIPKDIKRNPLLYKIHQKNSENIDITNRQYVKYLLAHFNALIDIGWRKKKLLDNKAAIENIIYEEDEKSERFLKYKQELIDKIGFDIEFGKIYKHE